MEETETDFSPLQSAEAYRLYFSLLTDVGRKLLALYVAEGQDGNYEAKVMRDFLAKFLYTIHVLLLKFTHSPAHNRQLWIDLSQSGFPNHAEFARLETDMLTRDSQLLDIPTETLLKLALLDYMFAKHEESADLLWQLSERAYLEGLDSARLFLAFSGGELLRQSDTKTTRAYTYSWACFDFETNRPYLHVMGFEQDKDADPLEDSPTLFRQFLKVVRAEGSRVPEMQILGASIDEALTAIHPKIIKRVGVGPLYSPLLLNGDTDKTEQYACSLLSNFGHRLSDFVLTITTEVLFSESQKPTRGIFSSKRMMEIFHIPSTDEEAFRRRASMVRTNIMLPHVVNQHLTAEDAKVLVPAGAKIITYDEEGDVHGSA